MAKKSVATKRSTKKSAKKKAAHKTTHNKHKNKGLAKLDPRRFHVVIYGSARIKHGDPRYRIVYNLAKMVGEGGMDVVTGGGPGLMNAASRGHHAGRKDNDAQSVGLTIHLPIEKRKAYHLQIKEEFDRFSPRLDKFMELANVVVVAPGGIGTLLELFYTWQVVQVKQLCETPIILLGKDYEELIAWMKSKVLRKGMISADDFKYVFNVSNCTDAMKIIDKVHKKFKSGKHVCENFDKYRKKQ